MSTSRLTLQATQQLRNSLLGKNLPPYNIPGQYTPNTSSYRQPINLSDFSVIDSPNEYITNPPFRNNLYPLNPYGPSGGFNLNVNINYPSLGEGVLTQQGEYNPNETNLDLVNESFINLGFNENRYGPEAGFNSMYYVSNEGNTNKIHLPYWDPPTFVPSSYSPIQILVSNNPNGDIGLLSQDSSLAIIGAKRLKSLFEERINIERIENITNFVNKNYTITIPENILTPSADFFTRLSDSYVPRSPIPGSYYDENEKKGQKTNQTSRALSTINNLTGGLLGPILNTRRNPSQLFLANTGSGQKSVLFDNINLNQYQPDYNRFRGGLTGLLTTLGRSIINLFDNTENGYYVGSSKKEPGGLKSPKNQIPINEFGKQISAPVYGPTDLSLLYEGNENKLNFGLAGKPLSEGGGIDGQFVWVSPKYKNNAGYKVTPGGGSGKKDEEFFQVSAQFQKNQSTNVELKKGSILDDTQRLIDSADKVSGIARLKHVGNAINQVSKVFNDGYKELTKGSKVLSYIDNATGREDGIEYARVFTKDTPYYTYKDLQKKDGITNSGRRFSNSVLDNTYNLNIAPLRGNESTNIKFKDGKTSVKKYMFSIENLAWRTSTKPGFTVADLPDCERGPNGGRIMWFPPYDLKFSDSSTPQFQGTSFLGRPEPMYTYKETSRSGTLSWKIIVDHPSILNIIVRRQLKGAKKEKIDSILNSFFAGAMKYDIYELAKRFGTVPPSIISAIQQALNDNTNTDDAASLVNEIPSGSDGNANRANNNDTSLNSIQTSFSNFAFYFPKTFNSSRTYDRIFNNYKNSNKKDNDIFEQIIDPNYQSLKSDFINQIADFVKNNNGTLKINFVSTIQNIESGFGETLADKQKEVVIRFFNQNIITKPLIQNEKLIINIESNPYLDSSPTNGGSLGTTYQCALIDVDESSKSSTACRRVYINNLEFIPKEPTTPSETSENNFGEKPKLTQDLFDKFKNGISKKIIRNLLTECDYFDMIKEDAPMVYDSIQEKIKYFTPAFHSMTPEGLNARLTFLNQCVRPGETIPTIGINNELIQNNATNTSFGAPPILVLRIGDFFHTKIVPTSLSLGYDPLELDMNPEGIGIQPMMASVSLNFNIIGGMGIAKPVEELQNALSFNFYANTEIYDERATETEDRSKIDKEFYQLVKNQVLATPSSDDTRTNDNGNTIGQILSGTDSGEIDYSDIMNNKLLVQTGSYFEFIVNALETMQEQFNLGIAQILNYRREYNFGSIQKSPFNPSNKDTIQIFGKPFGWETSINNVFDRVKSSIDDNTNPIIDFLSKFFVVNDDSYPIRDVKNYMKEYLDNLAVDFLTPIARSVQEIVEQQTSYVQTIRKLNVIVDKTDGKIGENGLPKVYNISGTPYNTLVTDFGKLKVAMDRYIELLSDGENPIAFYESESEINLVNKNKFSTEAEVDFFVLMARIFTDKDKKQEFIDSIIKNELTSERRLSNKLEKIVNDLEDKYKNELNDENRLFRKIKRKSEFRNLTKGLSKIMYKTNVNRKCGYNTERNESIYSQQETILKNLYASVNSNNDTSTFDGKIKFSQ